MFYTMAPVKKAKTIEKPLKPQKTTKRKKVDESDSEKEVKIKKQRNVLKRQKVEGAGLDSVKPKPVSLYYHSIFRGFQQT